MCGRFRVEPMARKHSRNEVLGTLRRASTYLRPYLLRLTGVFFLILAASLLSLAFPAMTGWIIDYANGRHPVNMKWAIDLLLPRDVVGMHALVPLFLLFAFFLALRTLALLMRNQLVQRIGMRVTCDLRIAVFSHLQNFPSAFTRSNRRAGWWRG